jgi:hypothetical protein
LKEKKKMDEQKTNDKWMIKDAYKLLVEIKWWN